MGAQQQRFERSYQVPADRLFEAFREAVDADRRFKDVKLDTFTRSAAFRSKPTMMSWGQNWQGQVQVEPVPLGSSRLVLTAGSRSSNPLAVSGTRQASQMSADLFAAISQRLGALQR